jgi:hypothetical protein
MTVGPCSSCAKPVSITRTSRPEPVCHTCRRLNPRRRVYRRRCIWCADRFTSKLKRTRYCSCACYHSARGVADRIRAPEDQHAKRHERERSAPGLAPTVRRRLLASWRRQGKRCAYCNAPATTIDHVIPLVRGGTNHEGNLAPCCKWCNSSKAGWLVIEWRTGKRLDVMAYPLAMRPLVQRTPQQ